MQQCLFIGLEGCDDALFPCHRKNNDFGPSQPSISYIFMETIMAFGHHSKNCLWHSKVL